jgi:conjugative relaxase-like TrwC/TraI family protein
VVTVLRVSTLYAATAASTAQYYTRYLTQADGEQPGRWTGHQAGLLGLGGEGTTDDLQALLEGRDPITGSPLGNPFVDRVTKSGKVVHAVAGFDATFSAPKSLSVWWALTGDEGLAECHDVAVRAVVDYVERYGSTTRVRSNGRRLHPDSQGLTAAVFRQTTSRLDDPQLHSHVVISSKVHTDDGRWLALDARTLKGFQRALGGLYQSVLRAELTARYEVAFAEIAKGQAEIAGMPDGLLERFSKRTEQVERALQSMLAEFYVREGRDPTPKEQGAMGRRAAENTRGHKTGHGVIDLRSRWLVEAAAVGVTPDSLRDSIREAGLSRQIEPQPVVIGDVIAAVTERRSAWHRLDVLQAICDIARPRPGVHGARWAAALDRATDEVLERCVDLDPAETHTRRRDSDGRSVWIEPSARHHTSNEVLAQEEHVLSWAIDAQLDPPTPSETVDAHGLDVMQAEAAAMVAGSDRLVLVVGPAGAGKTTMLHAAAGDLARHGYRVFGLAPTAKAARVLETETGMASDTVAKLLYEWHRHDRPPDPRWRLRAGTTVIIDEAGMLNTGDLYHLTRLADQQQWRLALVGDPHQLQAVGRGGMFAELCATGRTIELGQIHRFRNDWEAAASLKLRHGDPSGLDAYLDHDRIFAAPFAEHLDHIALAWTDAHRRGEYVAITTTTNDHVDAINDTIQHHRIAAGQLGACLELDDQSFHVGDVVTTRRNYRQLHTSTGDSVRNRDFWTIDAITPDGALAVTRIDGHGGVTLPAGYVAEHVQLGYAATEPGNQSDTAIRSLTLATPATTCRGLYVAITRGQIENLVLVATDGHETRDAIDVLEQILAPDRADLPATSVRRDLAAAVPPAPACSRDVRFRTGSPMSTSEPSKNSPTPTQDTKPNINTTCDSNKTSTSWPPNSTSSRRSVRHTTERSPPSPPISTQPGNNTDKPNTTSPTAAGSTDALPATKSRSPRTKPRPRRRRSTSSPAAPNHSSTNATNSAPNTPDSANTPKRNDSSPKNSIISTVASQQPK